MARDEPHAAALNGSQPWWVKAVATLGVSTILALGFFYWVTQSVDKKLDAIAQETVKLQPAHTALGGMVTAHVDSTGRVNAEILFVLRQLCVQGARNAGTDPRDCIPKPQDLGR